MARMAAGLSLEIDLAAELPFRVGAAAIDPQTREAASMTQRSVCSLRIALKRL